jgi:hypothetical protein
MAQNNSSQDLNFPDDENRNQLKKKLTVQKVLLDLIVIGSVLLAIYAIFTVKLINPPLPGGFG